MKIMQTEDVLLYVPDGYSLAIIEAAESGLCLPLPPVRARKVPAVCVRERERRRRRIYVFILPTNSSSLSLPFHPLPSLSLPASLPLLLSHRLASVRSGRLAVSQNIYICIYLHTYTHLHIYRYIY